MSDFDSPWKEALELYFEPFVQFFFPAAHADIDWSVAVEFLDKELQQVLREAEQGRRIVDKLAKVQLLNGQSEWVLVHIEVQGDPVQDFGERMFVCNYRLFDRYSHKVATLVVLADEGVHWRPSGFGYDLLGCRVQFDFPVAKLLDYAQDWDALEANNNPFAVIAMAHVKTKQTLHDPDARRNWKVRIVKGFLERGWNKPDIANLFRVIDWMMDLPDDLAIKFRDEIEQFEKGKPMPYITSVERLSKEEGRQEGRHEGLFEAIATGIELKFGAAGQPLVASLQTVKDLAVLRTIQRALYTAATLDEIRALIPPNTTN